MPRNMPMCHGQLNSTDFRSLLPSGGVYSSGGGPPNCAYATTDRTDASPVASAACVKVDPYLKAMVVPPIPRMLLLFGNELDRFGVRQRHPPNESQWLVARLSPPVHPPQLRRPEES